MADHIYVKGGIRPLSAPKQEPISPEDGRIALFALALTRSVGECDPYFCDGNDAGRFKCFFCGELSGNPHIPTCGHVVAKRLVEKGSLDDGA